MSLEDVASVSDVVIVSASLNESTKHIVNENFLAKMKKTSYLVNVSRGGLVDQEALLDALQSKQIKGKKTDIQMFFEQKYEATALKYNTI